MKTFLVILRDAVIAAAIFATIGIISNAVRSDGLPFIADKPYDIYVPCPEALGYVEAMSPTDERIHDSYSFIIDARTNEEFDEWHIKDAFNITYDYLDPIPDSELKNITMNIARSGMVRVVVYGDGDGKSGSTGYELGRELSGHGIKNVYVIEGGVDALKGGSHE